MSNNPLNLPVGLPMHGQMMPNSEELAKMMNQYQQKTVGGANFNGAHLQPQ
jgi:hypothetical protein